MADIFVNYRSEDGQAAGRLTDRLQDDFDVFIDVKMESGDSISGEIASALRETRVFLAVIGRQWMSRRNLKRLFDAKDWIRRELLGIHARRQSDDTGPPYVVPILMDDGTKMPREDQLPAELAWFADEKAKLLFHREWDSHYEQLVSSIRSRLGRARQGVRSGSTMPPDMPYLCDRHEQEYDLSTLTANIAQTRSLVCILHGHKWEAHDKFLSRLAQLRVLDRLLAAGEGGVGHARLEWISTLARSKKFAEMLRYGIQTSVLQRAGSSSEAVYELLRNVGGPLVLTLQVTGSDIVDCGENTLRDLIAAWNELLAAVGSAPARAVVLWINVAYDDVSQVSKAMEGIPALTALGAVTEGHIQSWLDRPDVGPYVAGRTTQVLSVAQDARFYVKPGELHMQSFADAVTTLMLG